MESWYVFMYDIMKAFYSCLSGIRMQKQLSYILHFKMGISEIIEHDIQIN